MTELLTREMDALRRALGKDGDEIEVSMSRETAEWLAELLAARARGQSVLLTRGRSEVTPSEAADLLGMSRPQVRKLMDEGKAHLPQGRQPSPHQARVDRGVSGD